MSVTGNLTKQWEVFVGNYYEDGPNNFMDGTVHLQDSVWFSWFKYLNQRQNFWSFWMNAILVDKNGLHPANDSNGLSWQLTPPANWFYWDTQYAYPTPVPNMPNTYVVAFNAVGKDKSYNDMYAGGLIAFRIDNPTRFASFSITGGQVVQFTGQVNRIDMACAPDGSLLALVYQDHQDIRGLYKFSIGADLSLTQTGFVNVHDTIGNSLSIQTQVRPFTVPDGVVVFAAEQNPGIDTAIYWVLKTDMSYTPVYSTQNPYVTGGAIPWGWSEPNNALVRFHQSGTAEMGLTDEYNTTQYWGEVLWNGQQAESKFQGPVDTTAARTIASWLDYTQDDLQPWYKGWALIYQITTSGLSLIGYSNDPKDWDTNSAQAIFAIPKDESYLFSFWQNYDGQHPPNGSSGDYYVTAYSGTPDVLPYLRMNQRNDGMGIRQHPRLHTSRTGTSNSKQKPSAPRIGDRNRYW